MRKIAENIDLSKKVLDIDIDSPIFNQMLGQLNDEILRCIRKVYDKDFAGGEIALKLSVEIPETFKIIPKVDEETGEIINETYVYRSPRFEHKIATTLKKQYKNEGVYTDEREVKFEDDKFIAVPIKDPQMKMF